MLAQRQNSGVFYLMRLYQLLNDKQGNTHSLEAITIRKDVFMRCGGAFFEHSVQNASCDFSISVPLLLRWEVGGCNGGC